MSRPRCATAAAAETDTPKRLFLVVVGIRRGGTQ